MTDVATFLAHNGVKGMKWGVRKDDSSGGGRPGKKAKPAPELMLTKTFSTGDSVSIYKNPTPFLGRQLAKISPSIRENITKGAVFSLKDKDGKDVGQAAFYRKSDTELSLDWVGIKPKHRGKGYASAALQGVVKYAQGEGIKKLTLEVPGNAPDARHIYEKLGFKDDPSRKEEFANQDSEELAWGGLTPMVMHVDSVKHAEADSTDEDDAAWAAAFADEFAEYLSTNVPLSSLPIAHAETLTEFLAHHGIERG